MAMNGNDLGDALMTAVTLTRGVGESEGAYRRRVFRAMGGAIVSYIQANAQVATTGTATAVDPGVGTAPVTSTGSVT